MKHQVALPGIAVPSPSASEDASQAATTGAPHMPEVSFAAENHALSAATNAPGNGDIKDIGDSAQGQLLAAGPRQTGLTSPPQGGPPAPKAAKKRRKTAQQTPQEQAAPTPQDDWPPMSEILQSCFIFEPTTAQPSPITVLGLDCGRSRVFASLTTEQKALLQKADVICGGRQLLHELTGHAPEDMPTAPGTATGPGTINGTTTGTAAATGPGTIAGTTGEANTQHSLNARLLPLSTPLEPVITRLSQMRAAGERVVMLADGDPLLFGIGGTLVRLLGQDAVELVPAVSSLQQACARLALPWHRVICLSLHGRDDLGPLNAAVSKNAPLCVLTDARMSPDVLARHLLDRGVDWFTVHVFERMGAPDEQSSHLSMAQAAGAAFGPACTLILVPGDAPRRARLGLNASELAVDRGLISKKPVRAAALALLQIAPNHVVWDVGSGSGAVALEATVLAHEGRVVAVERSVGRAMSIQENRRRFGAAILDVRLGQAPECLPALPDPHRVFIGGGLSGEDGEDILGHVCLRLPPGGRVVASCVLLDSLYLCRRFFERLGWPVEISQIQASDGRELGGDVHLAAMNPVFLLAAQKPALESVGRSAQATRP